MDDDMQAIRETLARIEAKLGRPTARQCHAEGCKTMGLGKFCKRHRPVAGWAIADAARHQETQR